jgi:1-acyl-sn-glycerol-3-phosphate acyltransferase
MGAASPIVRRWGRLRVTGLELVPRSGPVLLVGNHDSYWDPVAVGVASLGHRQVRALAKSSLWKVKPMAPILNGMGQIPIDRGRGDAGAMDRAIAELQAGACIGVFPEGTRSLGRNLRARGGVGRLAAAVPEATVLCVAISGTTDVPRWPKRPRVRIDVFPPAGGGLQPGEEPSAFAARLLDEIRERSPRVIAGRKPKGPAPDPQ